MIAITVIGVASNSIAVIDQGEYSVVFPNASGYSAPQNYKISRVEEPTIDKIELKGRILEIEASTNVQIKYSINSIDFLESNLFSFSKNAKNTVYVHDINSCFTIRKDYESILIPIYLTPIHDGFNEKWIFRALEIYKIVTLSTLNRYVKRIAKRNNFPFIWDGLYRGRLLP